MYDSQDIIKQKNSMFNLNPYNIAVKRSNIA